MKWILVLPNSSTPTLWNLAKFERKNRRQYWIDKSNRDFYLNTFSNKYVANGMTFIGHKWIFNPFKLIYKVAKQAL